MTLNPKEQEIMKRYLDLPEDVQKALFAPTNSEVIFEIGKKHGLPVDKIGELADETGLVMLGMTKPSEYIRNLERRLEIEVIKSKTIAEDINQKVFAPIRESLKKIHGITPPPAPVGAPPPLTVRGGGEGGGVKEKVQQILKDRETTKEQKRENKLPVKIIMPSSPSSTSDVFPNETEKIPPTSPILSGKIEVSPPPYQGGAGGGQIPDVFVKKIPFDSTPNKPIQDPYKEPME